MYPCGLAAVCCPHLSMKLREFPSPGKTVFSVVEERKSKGFCPEMIYVISAHVPLAEAKEWAGTCKYPICPGGGESNVKETPLSSRTLSPPTTRRLHGSR